MANGSDSDLDHWRHGLHGLRALDSEMMRDQYFGSNGPFAEACEIYAGRSTKIPQDILAHAETLGNSRIAFCLGYAFAFVLDRRKMTISDADLVAIANNKISWGEWQEFVNGFKRFTAVPA